MNIYDFRILCRIFGKNTIHVEASHLDEIWNKLLNHINGKKPLCYVLTPANYEYIKSTFGTELTKEQLSKILKDRYTKLKQIGCKINLHIHLSMFPGLMSNKEKERIIKEAYTWFNSSIGKPNEVLFGWYESDEFSDKIAENLGLKIRKDRHFHIYDYWLVEK
jgi:hypothetical protein